MQRPSASVLSMPGGQHSLPSTGSTAKGSQTAMSLPSCVAYSNFLKIPVLVPLPLMLTYTLQVCEN